jgi:ABC-type Na+ efflux pump permease subunit
VYVAFIAPAFAQLFLDDFLAVILSQTAIALMQVTLFMIFLYFLIIPVSSMLRQEQTGQLEVFLAAPIKPSDVLLGEFLGNTPFYAIFMTVIMGAFNAALNPLGLDVMQMTIITLIFLVTLLSALWIGTVIAALLRTKLAKTVRGRDVGRVLAMIIALPLVFLAS